MKSRAAVGIHLALHDEGVETVEYQGEKYSIGRIDRPGKLFNIVTIEAKRFVTQNKRKPSSWTSWVEQDPERKLTWVFPLDQGPALGKIEQQGPDIRVYKLNPDEVVHQCSLLRNNCS